MDWVIFGAKTAAVVVTKMAANNAVPGLGAAVDFTQAAYNLSQGDKVGAAISTVSGVADLFSFGLFSSVKQAMTEGAKESTKEGAKVLGKKAGKEATKKFGQQVGRRLAQGTFQGGKEAAIKYAPVMAREVSKKATKELGERLGKDIARGLISESVEKVFQEGTKKAAGGFLYDLNLKVISTGGNDVAKRIFEQYFEDGIQQVIAQVMKQKPKLAFEFAKIAEAGALKELEKHIPKIIAKDFSVAYLKGAINSSVIDDIPMH
ncbi:uncharacterized protein LOC122962263 [Acropora millepora]|uniref:uncharacterized protein LOC122962263 n=1 Tax=Acropora millepora TaxID=45264 RepID=UPI001CF4E0D0|nr:uncharacterized protein LOC122962263 [Acropora millepora]